MRRSLLPHMLTVSHSLTNFNVAISVISLFVLLTKMILAIMHVYYPLVGTFVAVAMTALYATSVYGPGRSPTTPTRAHPSPVAWYIAKSCSYAASENAVSSCGLAKGTFAITCYMLYVWPQPKKIHPPPIHLCH